MTDAASDLSLESRARQASAWIAGSFAASQLLRLLSNLVLTRLLFAEAFGLMALVTVFLQGLQLFSDTGVQPSIVRSARGDDPAFLNTAWTVQVIRGFLLWGVACLAAHPFARFYDEPLLVWLIPIVGVQAALAGFNSTRLYALDRNFDQRRLGLVEIGSQSIATVTMIAWAMVDRSVWALVAGTLVGAVATLSASHLALAGPPNRFRWDPDSARSLLRFGRWIFLSTSLTFLAGHSDRLIFGRLVSLDVLGVYSIGLMLAMMPVALATRLGSRIVFPLLSQLQRHGEPLERGFGAARLPILVAAGWVFGGLAAGGPTAIQLLYDPRYEAAGWVVQILACLGWLYAVEDGYGSALLAKGRSDLVALGSAARLVGMALLIPTGQLWLGFPGAVAGFAASELGRYAVMAGAGSRLGVSGWRDDARLSVRWLTVAGVAWATARGLETTGAPVPLVALAIAAVVSLGWLSHGRIVWRALARGERS